MKIQEANIVEMYSSDSNIFKSHCKEVLNLGLVLDPNLEAYSRLQDSGSLIFLTATIDGEVVGYCSYIISQSLHFKDKTYCVQDLLYVVREYRGHSIGYELTKRVEQIAEEIGCDIMILQSKDNDQVLKGIASDLSYRVYENSFIKEFNNG